MKIKSICAGLFIVLLVVCFGSASGFGGESKRSEAVAIQINGTPFIPRDADSGEKMDILEHKGRIYLPVRAIGEAMDLKISWDEQTKTVVIVSK